MVQCNNNNNKTELNFYYSAKEIFFEVEKHTAYIGKNTSSQPDKEGNTVPLFERTAFTSDEWDLFYPYLKDAAYNILTLLLTYNRRFRYWCEFIPHIKTNFHHIKRYIVEEGTTQQSKEEYKTIIDKCEKEDDRKLVVDQPLKDTVDDGVHFTITIDSNFYNPTIEQPLFDDIYEAMVHYIIYRWFLVVNKEGAELAYKLYTDYLGRIQYFLMQCKSPIINRTAYMY